MNQDIKYGQITIHENSAGLCYMRFMEVCKDDPRKFIGRIMDPQTMTVVRYTQEDLAMGHCVASAVGHPKEGWGYLHTVRHSGNIASATEYWNSVHWGDVINTVDVVAVV